ncbi:MAG TPA: IclR family transcriptional regulator [Actinomycetes bacterium]|jgi:IclR family pca regulon transcriptional regulator|nr:IclR family transcriptional regulator [Actinomycetes bacterium]
MRKRTGTADGQAGARSLERALEMLRLFAEVKPEWKVSELSRQLEVPLASAYRIVRVLERSRYLDRPHPGAPLRLGLPFLRLGSIVLARLDIREVARPIMRGLATDLGETALLMVPFAHAAVCIENVEGTYPIRPRSIAIGEQMPFNAGAVPLAIFAFLPEAEQDRVLASPLPRIAESTLTDPERLRERCRHIRATGISYSEGEIVPGTAAIASPIFTSGDGEVAGSVGLTGLTERIVRFDDTIRSAAKEITRRLGGDPARIPTGD